MQKEEKITKKIIREISGLCRGLRRAYYLNFKKDYVAEQLAKRKGVCGKHGCCRLTLTGKIVTKYIIRCLDKKDETKCLRWKRLPFSCYSYPFDEKDKNPETKDFCNFYWEK